MITKASIAELQNAEVTLEAGEAVAIAQQLIRSLRDGNPRSIEPPYGPPTAANVVLNEDGSVTCRGCETGLAVFDVAIFVDSLLPASPRVPGGLRYAIARGMLAVDVAPFDSLEDFSQALAKYESGPREAVVRRLLERSSSVRAAPAQTRDRRRPRVSTSKLRHALREADARLFQQRLEQQRFAASMSAASTPAPRDRAIPAAAACVAVGALLFASGEFMHSRRVLPPAAAPPPAVAVRPSYPTVAPARVLAPLPAVAIVPPQSPVSVGGSGSAAPVAATARPALLGSARASTRPRAVHTPVRQSTVKTSPGRARPAADASEPSAVRRSVLDRLRLGWLRKAFREDRL